MTVPVEEAIAHILEWVDNGNPMSDGDDDDGDDDLDNLYGGDNTVRIVDCHSEEENNNRPSDTDSSDEEDDQQQQQQQQPKRRHPKKILTSNRLVNSIDSCLDPRNFDETSLPQNTMGTDEEQLLTGHLGPKSNINTPKINWTTTPPSTTGRQRSCDVIKSAVSTVRYANDFYDIRSTFSTLVTEEIITLIVEKTNKRLEVIIDRCAQKIGNNSRYGFIRKTDATEIYALIGLVYLRGLLG